MQGRGVVWAVAAAVTTLFVTLSTDASAAGQHPVNDCGQYTKVVANEKNLAALVPRIERSEDMQQLFWLAARCGAPKSSIAKVMKEFGSYQDIGIHRDLPNSMARDPSLSHQQLQKLLDDEFDREEEELAQLRLKMMKADPKAFDIVMRFMIQQQGDELYGGYALEVIARNFPEQYETYVKLVPPGTDLAHDAEEIRQDYFGKKDALKADRSPPG